MVEKLLKVVSGQKLQIHPSCFYLEWNAEDGPSARWVSQPEKSRIAFGTTVKWKDLRYDVYICSDTKNGPEDKYQIHTENPYQNVSYLKSHLQKSIRRSNSYKALKTALHFLDLNLTDFLRRLAIIALEDALPLEGFNILIWFLAAVSAGYSMSDAQICWCLGYVYDLSTCTHYEQTVHNESALPSVKDMRLFTLPPDGRDLVYSILLRQSYGGMKSDTAMCRMAAYNWANRYHTKSRFLELLKRKAKYITQPSVELSRGEWLLSAIDFHCCPNIVSAMWEKHDQYTEEEIRSAIWHCSSSVTDKKLLTEDLSQRDINNTKLQEIWRCIRKDFHGYGRFMLEKQG